MSFLPISQKEVQEKGWDYVDFVCVTGDAYVDHPSFGIAIISRELEALGYRVAILSQPKVSAKAFSTFGRPRLGFMITSGNIDSMVANYTVGKRKRNEDAYSPKDAGNLRPDRAATVYSKAAKEAYPDCPVILGGIEASLRRFAHYDYWADKVLPSILEDSGADMISYGMGELQTEIISRRLNNGENIADMTDIKGTACWITPDKIPQGAVSIASYQKVSEDKKSHAKAFSLQLEEQDPVTGRPIIQKHGERLLLQNSPMRPVTREELDKVFTLPFERYYHPSYEAQGGVKAIEEVEFSVMHNRGCFGHCNFCSIAVHQGRQVVSRSVESVVTEAEQFVENPRFKGYVHDVGGPTANFRQPSCKKQEKLGMCIDKKCLGTNPCKALIVDQSEYLDLLRRVRAIKGIKKVFVRSGLRFDYMLLDKSEEFLDEIVKHHVSGQLKVAPEHCSDNVLSLMGKPPIAVYERFSKKFYAATKKAGKEQYLVPYLMSSHPGSTIGDAIKLSLFLKKNKLRPEQVQDFYPTPGTISTCMFYTGLNPFDMKPVYVAKTEGEKKRQRSLLQYFKPENKQIVLTALKEANRLDLIGNGPECLVRPDKQVLEQRKNITKRKQEHERPDKMVNKKGKRIR